MAIDSAAAMIACELQPCILIADDQSDLLDALRLLLKGEGMAMEAVTSPEAILSAVAVRQFDLLLMDLNYTSDTTSGREGIDLVARVQDLDQLLPIIVMTGWGSVDVAVAAMRRGARNFVQKPWENADLLRIVRAEVEDGRLRRKRAEHDQRELDEARRIQRKLLPERDAGRRGMRDRRILAAGDRRGRRLLRCHSVREVADRPVHR